MVTAINEELARDHELSWHELKEGPSIMTSKYTVANCFRKDKIVAKANIHTLMSHVANTAVLTNNNS